MPKEAPGGEEAQALNQHRWLIVCDLVVLLALGLLFFWGASPQIPRPDSDMGRYQCYAIAFWQGPAGLQTHGLMTNAQSTCAFLAEANSMRIYRWLIIFIQSLSYVIA